MPGLSRRVLRPFTRWKNSTSEGASRRFYENCRRLWDHLRSHFRHFIFQSMKHLYEVMLFGLTKSAGPKTGLIVSQPLGTSPPRGQKTTPAAIRPEPLGVRLCTSLRSVSIP